MSRKHKRADDYFAEADFAQEAQDLRDTFDAERELHAKLQILTPAEQMFHWNSKARRVRGDASDRAIRRTLVCQMPKCTREVIRLGGESLGICYRHATDIDEYFRIIGEDFQNQLSQVARIEKQAWREEQGRKQAESRKIEPGWIYYIQVVDRIKIGYTVDLKRRLKQYPPDTPLLAMHPGTKQLESEMHAKFSGSKAAGREWFLDTAEIREHIREVIAQFGEPDRARYEHRGRMHSGLRAAPPKPNGLSI
jgi:hypothetical protein